MTSTSNLAVPADVTRRMDPEDASVIGSILDPKSVAIIGASDDVGRIGGRPIRYLLEAGFSGKIYPVNPNRDTVQALPAYPTIVEVPGPVDLAIVALPAASVLEALRACAGKGVKAAIVFSAGFAEAGNEGVELQREMRELVHRSGMRILGPNCLGAFNMHSGFVGTFTQAFQSGFVEPGPVAIASQSGACGGHLAYLCKQRGIGIGYWVTTGNEADVDVTECMLWLASQKDVRVIVVYVEAVRNGERFVRALRLARQNRKAVVVLKVGRSTSGAKAAESHTGALAGEDAVYDAVIRQFGAHRAGSMEELLDIAYACARGTLPDNRRLGIVTVSGGVGVQMADAAEEHGLDVATMPEAAQASIKEMLPFAGTRNPVDVTAQSGNDKTLLGRCLDVVMSEGGYGAVVMFLTSAPAMADYADRLFDTVLAVRHAHPDRLLVLSFVAPVETVRRFEAEGCLVFEDPNRAVRAIAALAGFSAGFDRRREDEAAGLELASEATAVDASALANLNESGAKQVLARAGIPTLREIVVSSPDEARDAAAAIGCPVVLKILSADIAHKTEVGGVALDLASPEAAAEEAAAMLDRVRKRAPEARIAGLLVAPMNSGGVETICGVSRDPVFGPVVMFGLGGVFVEVMRDVAFRLAPFDEREALSMLSEIRGVALLEGARGQPRADVRALAEVLARVSRFAYANRNAIEEIDINPLVVMPEGEGARALDALIVPRAR
jgi:acyl-CoA synthetase (NDP forming)